MEDTSDSNQSRSVSDNINGSPPDSSTSRTWGVFLMYSKPFSNCSRLGIESTSPTFLFRVQCLQYIEQTLLTWNNTLSGYLCVIPSTGLSVSSESGSSISVFNTVNSLIFAMDCLKTGSF